jgi:carbonic anhydrase/acetyltransferase-like protein (isoleucine patch superfamily)
MALYEFAGRRLTIGEDAFVHPEAVIIGGVTVGGGCYVGAGAAPGDAWPLRKGSATPVREP